MPRKVRESPKVIEEIEQEDTMEVVEDEDVSEQVKKVRAALASVSGQIEVS